MKRIVLALGLFLVTANAVQAQCRNPVPMVGGRTAIYRESVLDTPEKLRLALENPKVQKAFHQILDSAKMADRYDEVIRNLNALTKTNKYEHGTAFVWMAMRQRVTKKVKLLWDSCWDGPDPLEAWKFTMEVDGTQTTFIVPVKCLNLARLPCPPPIPVPPSCTLAPSVDCSSNSPRITITAATRGDAKIKCQNIKGFKPDRTEVQLDRGSADNECKLKLAKDDGGTFTFKATAESSKWPGLVTCETQAAVCHTPRPPTCENPPACNLEVTSSPGELHIDTKDSAQPLKIVVSGPEGKSTTLSAGGTVPTPDYGDYTVTLTASSYNAACKSAICSTTIAQPPILPCCGSAWLLRGFALGALAQGAQQNGHLLTASGQPASFELSFGAGLGGGFELERRFSPWRDSDRVTGWGWTLGLLRSDLATRWQIDFPNRFLLDHPRVPVTVATTGLNFHLPVRSWDLFIGPLIGYSQFNTAAYPDDSPGAGTLRANFENTFTYGANAGFDAWLGKCWGLTGGVEYLKFAAKSDSLNANVDPLLVRLGFVYHF